MDGFEKIELQSSSEASKNPPTHTDQIETPKEKTGVVGGRRFNLKNIARGRKNKIILAALFVIVFLIIVPGIFAALSAKTTYDQAKITIASLKRQDITQAEKDLKKQG